MERNTDTISNWGTWEELVLGGAVLRHGSKAWDTVAAELRSRTFYPFFFTPEVCKAKYQDLQKRYSGCTNAWFEELRKQRVAQLKRELEKSEGSIGSLESKLENLKSEKNGNYVAGHTESPPSVGNESRVDFPVKENSKDGFSVGSFTEETQTDSSPECRIPAVVVENKNEEGENATSKETILKKRRGVRKRKDITKEVIEANLIRDHNQALRINVQEEDNDRAVRSSNDNDDNDQTVDMGDIDLLILLKSIIESQNLPVFHRRTDGQRRGRYRNTIRQHMDLSIMRSRISDRSISSHKELYRDLLLLCNNAIVFYSKESREYKSAVSLRAYVTKVFRERFQLTESSSDKPTCSNPPIAKPSISLPVKPRSARPSHPKAAGKVVTVPSPAIQDRKKVKDTEVLADVVGKKKPVKVGRGGGSKRVETPGNGGGRKKARKR